MNRLWGNLFLLLAFPAVNCAVIAADGEPVSEPVGTAVSALTGAGTTDTTYPAKQSTDSINQYLSKVKELESGHGVYYYGLGETLLGLGMAYQNLGRHENALDVLNRSLYISRINDGLYNETQLPILELIIKSNRAISDLAALDQNYHYLYWVNRRNFGEDDPRLLPVIDRIGQWYLSASQLEPGAETFGHLLTANKLYNQAIAIVETHYGPNDERLINPLYGTVLANYLIYTYISNKNEENESIKPVQIGYDRRIHRVREVSEEQDMLDRMSTQSYRNGKKAMQRIVEVYANNPEISTGSEAEAMIHMGDWYLLHNRKKDAMMSYQTAYQLFDQNGASDEEINEILGQPKRLPSLELPATQDREGSGDDSNYVVASFDVTKYGRARNIRIVESNPADNTSLQRRTKNIIKATRFRPRFEDGNPVATADVNMRYIYHD